MEKVVGNNIVEAYPLGLVWSAYYPGFDSEHSYHQGIYVENHVKGDMGSAHFSAGQLPATAATSEFSVLSLGACCTMLI